MVLVRLCRPRSSISCEPVCSRGSDDEGDAAKYGGENASPSLAGSFEKTLYGARTLASNEVIELSNNFPADGLGAEHHARDRGCDEQYWRDRKERVIGERRAEAGGVVVPPRPECRFEHSHDRRRAHVHFHLPDLRTPLAGMGEDVARCQPIRSDCELDRGETWRAWVSMTLTISKPLVTFACSVLASPSSSGLGPVILLIALAVLLTASQTPSRDSGDTPAYDSDRAAVIPLTLDPASILPMLT